MWNAFEKFFLGKRNREEQNDFFIEDAPEPKKQKTDNNGEKNEPVTLPLEMWLKVWAKLESPEDAKNSLMALGMVPSNAVVNNIPIKFFFNEKGIFNGQPLSWLSAKQQFQAKARTQRHIVKNILKKHQGITEPQFLENAAPNIETFRIIEDWIYKTNLEIIKNKIHNNISNNNRLNLSDSGLSYFPLADLLKDERIEHYLSEITYLNLSDNQLSGTIPPELGQLHNLQELILAGNKLSGNIPSELAQLHNLQRLDLSYNQLSGTIPHELTHLRNLSRLHLSYNQFSRNIPSELAQLTNIFFPGLDLSNNQLDGEIPAALLQIHGQDAFENQNPVPEQNQTEAARNRNSI